MFSLSDPAVQSYILYSGILAVKMFLMGSLTTRQRHNKKVFANEEDVKDAKGKIKFDDPDVERVRRAHLNDLENIPLFWVLGALYLTTSPGAAWAQLLFRIFTAGRIVHTYAHAIKPILKARSMAFGVSTLVNLYMAFKVITHYIGAM